MDAEREAVLTSMGEELDAACRSLAKNGEDKLQVSGSVRRGVDALTASAAS